jgi:hypothetical protein
VLCVRNPLDVARSLARSDRVERGVELWLRYTKDSLAYTRGRPRLLLFYEDVIRDWRSELRRLATFIGAQKRLEAAMREVRKEKLVDDGLWHHRTEVADSLDDPRLPFPAKALYLSLVLARQAQPGSSETLPHGALESFADAALSAVADESGPETRRVVRESLPTRSVRAETKAKG